MSSLLELFHDEKTAQVLFEQARNGLDASSSPQVDRLHDLYQLCQEHRYERAADSAHQIQFDLALRRIQMTDQQRALFYYIASTIASQRERWKDALEALYECLTVIKQDADALERLKFEDMLGHAAFFSHHYDAAFEAYSQMIAIAQPQLPASNQHLSHYEEYALLLCHAYIERSNLANILGQPQIAEADILASLQVLKRWQRAVTASSKAVPEEHVTSHDLLSLLSDELGEEVLQVNHPTAHRWFDLYLAAHIRSASLAIWQAHTGASTQPVDALIQAFHLLDRVLKQPALTQSASQQAHHLAQLGAEIALHISARSAEPGIKTTWLRYARRMLDHARATAAAGAALLVPLPQVRLEPELSEEWLDHKLGTIEDPDSVELPETLDPAQFSPLQLLDYDLRAQQAAHEGGDIDAILQEIEQYHQYAKDHQVHSIVVQCLILLGSIHQRLQHHGQARQYFEKARQLFRRARDWQQHHSHLALSTDASH